MKAGQSAIAIRRSVEVDRAIDGAGKKEPPVGRDGSKVEAVSALCIRRYLVSGHTTPTYR
jgi:hypothetical protein